MRAPLMIAALWLGATACGRIGYEPADPDAGDLPTDTPPDLSVAATCNTAVQVATLPVPAGQRVVALDLAATTDGFVAVWPVADAVFTTGLAVTTSSSRGIQIGVNQSGARVLDFRTEHVSIAALGNDAVLGVDHPDANAIGFLPLDQFGYQRDDTSSHPDVRARGANFVVAEPDDTGGLYGVAGFTATDTVSFERDRAGHEIIGAQPALPGIVADNAALARRHDGWAVIAGTDVCDLAEVADNLEPVGAQQKIKMTCHNATLASEPGTGSVTAAWNCENDRVWIITGTLDGVQPAHHEVFGDADRVASDPRLAYTSAGLWYGFAVNDGRLGRALLDHEGFPVPAVTPDIVVAGGVGPYDLLERDNQAYLFWVRPADHSLWTMRLCSP